MARLAADANPNHGGRIRRCVAPLAYFGCFTESFRFPSSERSHPFCDRARQRWFTMARGLQSGREPEGVDLSPKELLSFSTFCAIHLPPCCSDHCRLLANLHRVRSVSQQALLCSRGEWHQSFAL